MRVENRNNEVMTLQQRRRIEDQNVQDVFSAVLAEAGRAGYASAETVSAAEALDEQVRHSWQRWYRTELLGRYRSEEAPPDLGTNFGEILDNAYRSGAYAAPKAFLRTLSRVELETVQNAHWLAESINIDSLSEEGAINLLLPPAAQVDLDRDGITQSGSAQSIKFPDSTTPRGVAHAWHEATDGMPLSERMHYELSMKLPVLLSNMVFRDDGSFSHQRAPGDPEFINPMISEAYSYVEVTKQWIEYLHAFRNQIDPDRFERDVAFWQRFQTNLAKEGR